MASWHNLDSEEALKKLDSSVNGLSEIEAKRRLEKYGLNELKEEKKATPLQMFLEQFKDALVVILIAAGIISALIGYAEGGDLSFFERYGDTIVILIVVIANAIIGFAQEYKADKAIEALKKMVAPNAKVVREGDVDIVPALQLVPGDVIILEAGDKIPADCRLLEEANLKVDEASLTGESVPVGKLVKKIEKEDVFIGERKNMLYMGTNVTYGRCKCVVVATGMNTEFGGIAHNTQSIEAELSPLQKELEHVGNFVLKLVLGICLLVFILGLTQGLEVLEVFLIAISLAVAAVPEGLPATVTIALAIGVQKMAKENAIIRKLSSVETLGSTTVICSDKTGTLTQNKMTVQKIYCSGAEINVKGTGYEPKGEFEYKGKVSEEDLNLMMRIGLLCNDSRLYFKDNKWVIAGDPTEGALVVAGEKRGLKQEELLEKYPRIGEVPFDSNRKRMSTIHKDGKKEVAYVKGAPDLVLDLCDRILENGTVRKLKAEDRERILKKNAEMAEGALRVLALAYKEVSGEEFTSEGIEKNLVFAGLVGMIDPPREDVPGAIALCKKAGIKVIIITGDFALTAKAIAQQIGLGSDIKVISGIELDRMKDDELKKTLGGSVIFARNSPEHKLRVVTALKEMGHIVAVTGDGVNDAPALKKSDIGVAMGISGTDVSKEASNMVLTNDDFASIVNAVKEGRTVYDSIKKFLVYLFSSNIGEVVAVFFGMLLGLPLILSAIQILWINLVTDLAPALALSVDPPESGIMERKPRDPKKRIVDRKMITRIMLIGLLIGFGTIAAFKWQLDSGASLEKAGTIAFTVIVLYQLFNVFNARSEEKSILRIGMFSNKWLWVAVLFSFFMQAAVTQISMLQQLFGTVALTPGEWLMSGGIALSILALDEARKVLKI